MSCQLVLVGFGEGRPVAAHGFAFVVTVWQKPRCAYVFRSYGEASDFARSERARLGVRVWIDPRPVFDTIERAVEAVS